ncbi:MAG: SDR family NAD(P)-dependent oxidoreductase [Acidimicrobiales bacterium]|jgi:NAD(P)-dependent dehydrogenase (short-subunit alcohol dehydrogenase family)
MRGLGGRTYIVTGAASGIGRATAARLLDEGALVMGADLVVPPDDVAEDKDESGRWAFTHVDVTDEDSVAALVRSAVEFGGSVDGLLHAAGVAGGGPVHMLPAEEWARVIAVNLTGTYLVAKHVIAQMLGQPLRDNGQRGSVVTVASIEGLEGTAGGSAYSASKGGVVLLTKNMAIDYAGRGIRVNAICPGFVETPMTASVLGPGMEAALADIVREHKLGHRMGQPEEIASVAAFLLSDDSSFVTGHALPVDGGYTAGRDHGVTEMLGLSGPEPAPA